jgi:thioredoxin reductase (NADPH)
VIIVGSGPAGYTAAVYAARARLNPVVFEGAVTAGGALMNTTEVENFPGFADGIMGPELMDQMRARPSGSVPSSSPTTSPPSTSTGVKTVVDGSGTHLPAHSVILAMGSAYRELGLPDEKRLSGHGVSWCATCDGFFFRDQDIAVVGRRRLRHRGGHLPHPLRQQVTSCTAATSCAPRRSCRAGLRQRPKIRFAWNSEVVALHGDDKVTGVRCATP